MKADMLSLLAFLVSTTAAFTLTCHCLNGSSCHTNGYCEQGCEKGWYGPGCQVGNVALGKPAKQSTTVGRQSTTDTGSFVLPDDRSAENAVDGMLPSNESSFSCTHTEAGRQPAWWVVTLTTTHDYVITNVTLVNRRSSASVRLANFVILYSNEGNNDPNPTDNTWHEFARENGTVGQNRTYTSKNAVIAKRVAVYLMRFSQNDDSILTLCEVEIYGYENHDCTLGFTGPGCLLRACDQCSSTNGKCTGDFESCSYDVCPDDSLLPPDCWITLSNFSGLSVQSTATCNSVVFSAVLPDSQPNIAATSLQLEVTTSSDLRVLKNAAWSLRTSNPAYYKFSTAAAATSYNAFVKLQYCDSTGRSCFHTTRSKVFTVLTGKREYVVSNNKSCVFINVSSATPDCELPSAIQVTCTAQGFGEIIVNSSGSTTCGLDSHLGYNCSFAAIINDNTIEIYDSYIAAEPLATTPAPEANVAVLAGSIGGSIALIIIIVAIVAAVFCRRKRDEKSESLAIASDANGNCRETTGARDVTSLPSFNNAGHVAEDDEQTYSNTSGMNLSQFQLYVQNEPLIARRFSELQGNEAHPCTQGRSPENKVKNRFQNILPYDINRVRLASSANDYINASYINGFSKPKEYIAAQGPSSKTVEDFWQMLWQEKCSVIIMLTDYVEHAKRKCEKYFPYSKSDGIAIEVTVRSSTVLDTHTVTLLDVRQGSEVRLVHHFHFLAWPDQSVPSHSAEVLLFYSRISLLLKRQPSRGPLMVHCSAGVGRTGAYIAFNYLQQRYQSDGTVDVDNCVVKLRDQRMLMVQTKEQYLFLHKAVLYGIKTMQYIYDAAQLPSLAHNGTSPSSTVDLNKATDWQELQAVVPKFPEQSFVTAMLPENRHKNRRSQILALEYKRPLPSRLDDGSQLYINAVYCNGCYSNRAFIATQMPLRRTIDDFWLMVYDCQPSCIVLLHELPSSDDEDCPHYWPDPGRSITAGGLEVKCLKDESSRNATMPGYDISLSPASGRMAVSQTVSTKLFTTSLWDIKWSEELPVNANDILEVAHTLRTYCVEVPQQPIIVQCRDGVTQSGLFLSAVNALHRLMETEQVSLFHTVDLLRTSRPEFVTSEAQYRFIYKIIETYRDSSSVYANT